MKVVSYVLGEMWTMGELLMNFIIMHKSSSTPLNIIGLCNYIHSIL